jgi:hypothetical protein
MKLLVKVIEAEYSDAAQIAIVDITWDFLVNARILVNEAELMSHELKSPVSLRIDNNVGEYFMVRHQDLPSLIQAEGRIADWDEFNHVVVEDESWSPNWNRTWQPLHRSRSDGHLLQGHRLEWRGLSDRSVGRH